MIKKQPKKLGNNVVFPIFITLSYNYHNDATTYYCLLLQKNKHTLPRMLKYFQVIKISKKISGKPKQFFLSNYIDF